MRTDTDTTTAIKSTPSSPTMRGAGSFALHMATVDTENSSRKLSTLQLSTADWMTVPIVQLYHLRFCE